MKLIVLAIIVGVIALAAIVIYLVNSGLGTLRRERDRAVIERNSLDAQLSQAKRGLLEIAGNQTGNPGATAIATLDAIEHERQEVTR